MLIDTRILQRHDGYDVLAECQTVTFSDGEAIQLHYVRRLGLDDLFLRAWEHEPAHWCVVDLRAIDKRFATEIPYTLHRDRPGLVMYTLRAQFPKAVDFETSCFRLKPVKWLALAEYTPRTAGAPAGAITFQPELRSRA